MKHKSYRVAFKNNLNAIKKNKGNYESLIKVIHSIIYKSTILLLQKVNITLFRLLNYKQYKSLENDIYIIYTMAKVGSSSVYNTLRFNIPHSSLFHVHFLTEEGLKKRENFHNDSTITHTDRKLIDLIKSNSKRKLKIITLVREPVSRNISDLFESLPIYFPEKNINEITIEDLQMKFKENGNSYVLNWFDEELCKFLNFNLYNHSFDPKKGYQIYKGDLCDILLMRLENLTQCFPEAIFNFTGIRFERLYNTNESRFKESAQLNQKFKKEFIMDKQALEELYSSTYVKHFYTEEEIKFFIQKYSTSSITY